MIVTWLNHRMSGYLFVEMTGFSPERFFNMCSVHEIEIWGVSDTGHSYRFYMTVKGFRKIKPIVRKSKVRLKVLGKFGLPFFFIQKQEAKALRGRDGVLFCPALHTLHLYLGYRV